MSFNTDRLSNILSNMEMNTSNLKYAMKNNVTEILKKKTGDKDTEIEYLRGEIRRLKQLEEARREEVAIIATETEREGIRHGAGSNNEEMISAVEEALESRRVISPQTEEYYRRVISTLEREIEEKNMEIERNEEIFSQFKEQTERKLKKQLTEILHLKGAIRVVIRIKPFHSIEKIVITDDSIEIPSKGLTSRCSRVLSPTATQEDLFAEIEDLIYSVTKGHRVSILAYGPTGSGKTYTMEGPEEISGKCNMNRIYQQVVCKCKMCSKRGAVYRSMSLLQEELERMRMIGYSHSVRMTVTELYNDKIINTAEEILSVERIPEIFEKASKNRKVGSTECNLRSSRSHLILTVDVRIERSTEEGSVEYIEGSLCICDLAGSERLTHSKAEGDRMREAIEINKSLSALGDVVYAIANKTAHIPYRNSKLTTILRNTLGLGAKTAFIINIDPGASIEETVTALRFSNRLQECILGQSRTDKVEVLR